MIQIKNVQNAQEGIEVAKKVLYENCNTDTVLFLSGGRTPKTLYELLTQEKKLQVGAVGMVDERYGQPFHKYSNEKMIQESGLLAFFESKDIPFNSMLDDIPPKSLGVKPVHPGGGIVSTPRDLLAKTYDGEVKKLFKRFSKKIAILGIGADGHTAGLPAGIKNYELRIKNSRLVAEFKDFPGPQRERITMTFEALSKLDLLIPLVFGEDKKEALIKMFERGSEYEIPARFFLRPEITPKTLLITDQKI